MAKPNLDETKISQSLKAILSEIHDTSDPTELNELRRIFRKNIPLFSRAYVAGYLMKKVFGGSFAASRPQVAEGDKFQKRTDRPDRNEKSRTAEKVERPPREPREQREPREPREAREPKEGRDSREEFESRETSENMTNLFISIGRTRRIYPRDLMTLLIEQGGIQKEQVGSIRILDNYSFVHVHNDVVQGVMEKLNNSEYRGRTLSVNFAKKTRD